MYAESIIQSTIRREGDKLASYIKIIIFIIKTRQDQYFEAVVCGGEGE